VVLRPLEARDLDAVVAACSDPLVRRYTRLPWPYGAEDGRRFIDGAEGRRLRGESLELAIAEAGGGRLLGAIGVIVNPHDPLRGEVGYWVAPAARGAGVARRALWLLSRWLVRSAGFARLDLQAAVTNAASVRVAEHCGFVREGTLRRAWHRAPEREDMAIFALLPEDLDH
jgi:RimJ/RimL family protein N-acetyltransferase